ncbi:unnamed protein product [Menidia menidia]|uniref:(Atlantic silverside) hypothetical protein n=1 Tax=Menidia menidia TaxID=238744 RepID=A0A8S4B663_9TELE|nr:unnamed protein product [Menidia menidia]
MEILDSSEPFLHWDRNLSELSEAGEIDCVLYTNPFFGPLSGEFGKAKAIGAQKVKQAVAASYVKRGFCHSWKVSTKNWRTVNATEFSEEQINP